MADKIAVIKTGWSDDFMGSPVEADHQHVRKFKDGHEKYNFLPRPDGRFYAYTPPLGRKMVAPRPKELEGWLVFSVAKKPKERGLYLTGWYEGATFVGDFADRPEYDAANPSLPRDENGQPYQYILSALQAAHLDLRMNKHVFAGEHMKRASVFYLRGNGVKNGWCEDLAQRLLEIRQRWNNGEATDQSPVIDAGQGGICADAKRRQEVEQAAVALVRAHYSETRYEVIDRQSDNCGFDLLVRAKKSRDELHVEVKGTQNKVPHFLMSHKEYAYMQAYPRCWRLAMVTEALSKSPKLEIMDAEKAQARFSWKEFTWHATSK
ncbi:DUF3883 domain-containing protein [Dongia deserti]|uniref:DUF3883 domain-containing protein n=1 Tax=Dongia deserti TaxID=2268030 RepID=UPI0013C3E737|nr:DUF3883 domain-containing protein [Dongia deserti]